MTAAVERVLILGERVDLKQATCFEWDQVPRDLYPGDFDVVLLALESRARKKSVWHAGEGPVQQMFWRMLAIENLTAVAITSLSHDVVDGATRDRPWWLPFAPDFVRHKTTVLRDVVPELRRYMDLVGCFPWHLEGHSECPVDKHYAMIALPHLAGSAGKPVALLEPRAHNSGGKAVALETRIEIPVGGTGIEAGGRSLWLPPPTRGETAEAIVVLLQDFFGLQAASAPPEWVSGCSLPRLRQAEENLARLEEERTDVEHRIAQARSVHDREGRYRGLLYAYDRELETLVHEALRDLGASLQPPRPARDDGRLTDPFGRGAILEIKGVEGSLKLAHLRELNDWASREIEADPDWDGKQVLILNPQRGTPPAERASFCPDDCRKAATRWGQSVVTTMQIFRALADLQDGVLDQRAFWDAVLGTTGLASLPG